YPSSCSFVKSAIAAYTTLFRSCSEIGRNVVISGAVSGTTVCTAGAWSTSLNLSAVADGAVSLAFNHSDAAGNTATTVNLSLTKDTVAPTLTTTSPAGARLVTSA